MQPRREVHPRAQLLVGHHVLELEQQPATREDAARLGRLLHALVRVGDDGDEHVEQHDVGEDGEDVEEHPLQEVGLVPLGAVDLAEQHHVRREPRRREARVVARVRLVEQHERAAEDDERDGDDGEEGGH
eukprot:3057160-Prymnesium_polylepis.2